MFGGILASSRTPLGLDFGSRSVRLLQLGCGKQEWAVAAAAEAALPADLPAQGPDRHTALVELLKGLLAQGGFRGRKVVSCLPSACVQYKSVRLPRMPDEEMRTAVEWEAKERMRPAHASANAGELIVQFYDAGEVRQGEEARQEIIVMAAEASAVTEHVAALRAAGLVPLAIDAAPSALARALARTGAALPGASTDSSAPEEEAPARFILDVGFGVSKVLIVRQGRIVFYKTIEIGGGRFDQTVATKLNLPLADAAHIRSSLRREEPAAASPPLFGSARRESVERAVFEALRPLVEELVREVGLCLRYYGVTFRGRRPEQVLLAGGEAGEPSLIKALTQEASLQVAPAQPLVAIDPALLLNQGVPAQSLAAWSVATGLCLRPPARQAQRRAA